MEAIPEGTKKKNTQLPSPNRNLALSSFHHIKQSAVTATPEQRWKKKTIDIQL